jgi:hypothetical protein
VKQVFAVVVAFAGGSKHRKGRGGPDWRQLRQLRKHEWDLPAMPFPGGEVDSGAPKQWTAAGTKTDPNRAGTRKSPELVSVMQQLGTQAVAESPS